MEKGRRFPPSVFCPYFQRSLELIGRRWTAAILRAMFAGKERFSDMQSSIPGISPRLLSQRLSELSQAGLVARRRGARRGTYVLTDRGADLREALAELEDWNQRWDEHDEQDSGLSPGPSVPPAP